MLCKISKTNDKYLLDVLESIIEVILDLAVQQFFSSFALIGFNK